MSNDFVKVPFIGEKPLLLFLSAKPSSWSRILGGLFELTQHSSRALDSPRVLLPELCTDIQGHCQVWRARRGGPRTPTSTSRQLQLTQTLIVLLLKTHFFTPILDFEKSTE